MNERIRELAEQAAKDTSDGYPVTNKFAEKFAELIVRECIDNLSWHGHDEAVSQLEWFKVNRLGIKSYV